MVLNTFPYEYEINQAKALASGTPIPQCVVDIINYCLEHGIGFILSRNDEATSCRDARSKRVRLGHIGIPLYDEFKSIVVTGVTKANERKIAAIHCRGHMSVDLSRVAEICEFVNLPNHLPEQELYDMFAMIFGTVNPITAQINSNDQILHIFDTGLLIPVVKYPGTMMTNAGERTWGIEFDPVDLVNAVIPKIVADIAIADRELEPYELPNFKNPRSIGIITGNGPDSGIALWQNINKCFVRELGDHFWGDMSLPTVNVLSIPAMGLSMELEKRENVTWDIVKAAVTQLVDNGTDIISLACHTTHYFTEKIRELLKAYPGKIFISMPETVVAYVHDKNIDQLAIVGIPAVAELGEYSAYSSLTDLEVERVSSETMSKFNKLGYDVKKMSNENGTYQRFRDLLLYELTSHNIIIALTELSLLCSKQPKALRKIDRNIIDPLEIYAETIVKASLLYEQE